MWKIIKQNLEKIGFKENEIKVYLACLQFPQGLLVVDIVKQTNIKRGTVNLILERLTKAGYVTFYLDGHRKRYQAENLETIIFNFEENLKELKSILPLLLKPSPQQKTKVRFFQGKDGLEQIFYDILLSCKLAKNLSFTTRFIEMAGISLSIALVNFLIDILVRKYLILIYRLGNVCSIT